MGIVFQDPDRQIIASTVEGEISFGLFNLGYSEDKIRYLTEQIIQRMGLTHLAHLRLIFKRRGKETGQYFRVLW